MATFKEVLSYLLNKDTGGTTESTGPVINPQTNLPSVSSTIASVKPAGTSAGWFSEPVVTSEPPQWQGAASTGHPAGDAMRQDPYQ